MSRHSLPPLSTGPAHERTGVVLLLLLVVAVTPVYRVLSVFLYAGTDVRPPVDARSGGCGVREARPANTKRCRKQPPQG